MSASDFHIVTQWRVKGTREEIIEIFKDIEGFTDWWPSVYLEITQIAAGDEDDIGSVYKLHTKGWLPYHLNWNLTVKETHFPDGSTITAEGDLNGQGSWTFEQDGEWVNVRYDWNIVLANWFKTFAFLMKPVFVWNHKWAMKQDEASLQLELMRRRAASPEERARIPAPPGPTFVRRPDTRRSSRLA